MSDEEEFPKHRVARGRRACVREEMLLIWDFRNQDFADRSKNFSVLLHNGDI